MAPPHAGAQGESIALRAAGIWKAFPGTQALADASLSLRRGEVHGLLGGNGSGKSTLIKVLAGVERGDRGEIAAGDRRWRAEHATPEQAAAAGLRFVHQQGGLFDDLSVTENLLLARGYPRRGPAIAWRDARRDAAATLERFAIPARPDDLAGALSPSVRAMVAIARALGDADAAASGVLVLDEPTVSLPAPDVDRLLAALARLAGEGHALLLVTHRLDEVLRACHRVTVLRDGRNAGTAEASSLDHDALVELIVGRAVAQAARHEAPPPDGASAPAVEVRGLAGGPVVDAAFALRGGEVVGLAGLVGSGRSSLLRMLFGAQPRSAGAVQLDGAPVDPADPAAAMRAGIALVPEDRAAQAAFPELTVRENLLAAVVARAWRRWRLDGRRERADAAALVRDFGVRTAGDAAPMAALSGGNQQKVVLARWLTRAPRLLLLDEPTQGVDVGARAEIWAAVARAAGDGAAVLVASSDFEELAAVCDRVLVLRAGRIAADVPAGELSADLLTTLANAPEDA